MKKIIVYVILACVCSSGLQAQKNINLIINIDDKTTKGLTGLKLIASLENGMERIVETDYYPGNLSLKEDDYTNLLDTSVKTIFIAFNYDEYCKNKHNTYNYKINLGKRWLRDYFYILQVYNTNKRKYKKVYTPLEGESYTYEYDSPSGSTRRVTKKRISDCD